MLNQRPELTRILSEKDIEVMAMFYFDGLSMQEIGDLFRVHKSSIRDRLNKCLRILLEHGLPTPSRTPSRGRGRKIHADASMMNAIVYGHLPELIVDYVDRHHEC